MLKLFLFAILAGETLCGLLNAPAGFTPLKLDEDTWIHHYHIVSPLEVLVCKQPSSHQLRLFLSLVPSPLPSLSPSLALPQAKCGVSAQVKWI